MGTRILMSRPVLDLANSASLANPPTEIPPAMRSSWPTSTRDTAAMIREIPVASSSPAKKRGVLGVRTP